VQYQRGGLIGRRVLIPSLSTGLQNTNAAGLCVEPAACEAEKTVQHELARQAARA